MTPNVLQAVWAGLGALALAALVWWGWRRRPAGRPSEGGLAVRGSVGLGPGAKVTLLAVGDREVLVGAAPGRVTLLGAWPAPRAGEEEEASPRSGSGSWDEATGALGDLGVGRRGRVNRFGVQRYGQP